jgi:hypothetical protein
MLGRLVRVLADENRPAGRYLVLWDGKANDGTGIASGVYFCRMTAGGFSDTKRMTLMK